MTAPIRVLIVDDQALVRGSFRVLVETAPGMTAVGEAGTGAEAVALARTARPDVILMDIRMPEMDGIEATRQICAGSGPAPRVLVLTTFDLDMYVFAALRAGASGFLLKDIPPADLLAGIRVVASGEGLLAPTVTRRLIAEFARSAPATPSPAAPSPAALSPAPLSPAPLSPAHDLEGLTDRELQVLTLIARGLSNAEIGDHLRLRPPTVKTHIGHLLAKLGARDRAQLVIAAYESGLTTAESRGR